jgi:hypothetical protein
MLEVSFLEDNLLPFMTALGWLVAYQFDDGDWAALSYGLRDSDAEAGQWYEYEFSGRERLVFSVALDDSGSSVVYLRVALPEEFEPQVKLLAEFCWHFHWRGPGGR